MTLLRKNFKQKNGWTCGPAVARIVCHYYGHHVTIRQLADELRTTRDGTSNRGLLRALKKRSIRYSVRDNVSLTRLRQTLKKNIVIVAYWIPRHKEAHYSIVTRVDRNRVYFHDPWFGSRHTYTHSYFEKNWWDDEATRWMLAMKK